LSLHEPELPPDIAWPVEPNPPRAADELELDELDEPLLETALTRVPLLLNAVETDDEGR
jgi:hypothetical protein